jgi:hypothetical protein
MTVDKVHEVVIKKWNVVFGVVDTASVNILLTDERINIAKLCEVCVEA